MGFVFLYKNFQKDFNDPPPPRFKKFFSLPENLTGAIPAYEVYRLDALERRGIGHVNQLPFSIRILLENLLRMEDGRFVRPADIEALSEWQPVAKVRSEIAFMPARVLLQDFTGVPAVADLAAMRDAMARMGGDPKKINPLLPAELVIDHSVQVDKFGTDMAFAFNAEIEFQRNVERYGFLRWGQKALRNFQVVPPDTGIVHQVNLEYLARVVFDTAPDGPRRLSRFAGRHRFAHHHGQRPGRARLGRGRHRSRGRHARPAALDAHSRRRRLQAARPPARRRDGHRPGADRHADAAQERASSESLSSSTAPGFPA